MKKSIFLMAIIFATTLSFGQIKKVGSPTTPLSNQEIANIINMSREANMANGVFDPNKINPGQRLTFRFENDSVRQIVVEAGDNQWKILKNKLAFLIAENGNVVNDDGAEILKEDIGFGLRNPDQSESNHWWVIALILLGIIWLIVWYPNLKKRNESRRDPATDHPMHPGGVNDRDAVDYMNTVASRNGYTRFGVVTKGRITTADKVRVAYSDGARMERLVNDQVFHSKARRSDGTECDIVYKQVCGNDATEINMQRATFVPDSVQSSELRTANQQTQPVASASKTAVSSPTNTSSIDLFMIANEAIGMLKTKENGKIEIISNGTTIRVEFDGKAGANGVDVIDQVKEKVSL